MIKYRNPNGKEVISSNDHVPRPGRKDRKDEVITTADITRGLDNKFDKKGGQDEKSS